MTIGLTRAETTVGEVMAGEMEEALMAVVGEALTVVVEEVAVSRGYQEHYRGGLGGSGVDETRGVRSGSIYVGTREALD